MRVLLTGVSGYVGGALVPRLLDDGHELVGVSRDPSRVPAASRDPSRVPTALRDPSRVPAALRDPSRVQPVLPVRRADLVTGVGLREAMEGIDVAYFLIHSMEASANGAFPARERTAAENFAAAAGRAGVRRIVYLGGLLPAQGSPSRHLASRLAVEEILLGASPSSVALRASIVIGARSRSFRFLVRLVERIRVMVLPAWHNNRTQPLDERDMIEFLARAATAPEVAGLSLDIAGPDVLSYREMIERIAEAMLIYRPALRVPLSVTPVASRVAAAVAGEDPELIEPLMESLETDLLARDDRARQLLGMHLHSFERAVDHALRDWEATEELVAR